MEAGHVQRSDRLAIQLLIFIRSGDTTPVAVEHTLNPNIQVLTVPKQLLSNPVPRSPLKRMTLGSHQFHKSPLKAASDRILKKYTSVSPHKRPGHYLFDDDSDAHSSPSEEAYVKDDEDKDMESDNCASKIYNFRRTSTTAPSSSNCVEQLAATGIFLHLKRKAVGKNLRFDFSIPPALASHHEFLITTAKGPCSLNLNTSIGDTVLNFEEKMILPQFRQFRSCSTQQIPELSGMMELLAEIARDEDIKTALSQEEEQTPSQQPVNFNSPDLKTLRERPAPTRPSTIAPQARAAVATPILRGVAPVSGTHVLTLGAPLPPNITGSIRLASPSVQWVQTTPNNASQQGPAPQATRPMNSTRPPTVLPVNQRTVTIRPPTVLPVGQRTVTMAVVSFRPTGPLVTQTRPMISGTKTVVTQNPAGIFQPITTQISVPGQPVALKPIAVSVAPVQLSQGQTMSARTIQLPYSGQHTKTGTPPNTSISVSREQQSVAVSAGGVVAGTFLPASRPLDSINLTVSDSSASTTSMYLTLLSIGAWFHQQYKLAIFFTALSTFLSWPFAALIGLPIAVDIVLLKRQVRLFTTWCLISAGTILGPQVMCDSYYYGRPVFASLNIVWYNVFTSHGPDLYGTEPPEFYLINGILNFNFVFILAFVLPIQTGARYLLKSKLANPGTGFFISDTLSQSPMYLWLLVFWTTPHKEERFLFPIYPLICLAGAMVIDSCQKLFYFLFVKVKSRHFLHHTTWLGVLAISVSALLSLSRMTALYQGYHGVTDIWMRVNQLPDFSAPTTVCVGKEWYRYQSSFFLPSTSFKIAFLKSDFRGQLPKYYSKPHQNTPGLLSTQISHSDFNDLNMEETSRYINHAGKCHFLVDLEDTAVSDLQPNYASHANWTVEAEFEFLDPSASHPLFRALYVPWLSRRFTKYNRYLLLRRVSPRRITPSED